MVSHSQNPSVQRWLSQTGAIVNIESSKKGPCSQASHPKIDCLREQTAFMILYILSTDPSHSFPTFHLPVIISMSSARGEAWNFLLRRRSLGGMLVFYSSVD